MFRSIWQPSSGFFYVIQQEHNRNFITTDNAWDIHSEIKWFHWCKLDNYYTLSSLFWSALIMVAKTTQTIKRIPISDKAYIFNASNAELNPICHLLALFGAHHILHIGGFKVKGDRGSTVVKMMCYKSEGRWFDPSWCHRNFHWSHYGRGVDSASNRNEYQEYSLGVNAAGAWGWQPTTILCRCNEIWEP